MVRSTRTGLIEQDVRDDFDRARRRANWAKIAGWLLGRPASRNRLAVLGEVASAPGADGPGRRLEYERVARLRLSLSSGRAGTQAAANPRRCHAHPWLASPAAGV